MAVHSRATGLPLPLDMMDQNVGLPAGFTREFVEEIEANLIKGDSRRESITCRQRHRDSFEVAIRPSFVDILECLTSVQIRSGPPTALC
jgi:hypothetical protein